MLYLPSKVKNLRTTSVHTASSGWLFSSTTFIVPTCISMRHVLFACLRTPSRWPFTCYCIAFFFVSFFAIYKSNFFGIGNFYLGFLRVEGMTLRQDMLHLPAKVKNTRTTSVHTACSGWLFSSPTFIAPASCTCPNMHKHALFFACFRTPSQWPFTN